MNSYVSTKFALLELMVRTLHVLKNKNNPPCYSYPPEPFRVGFDRTMYTVAESADSVEVCVNLTQPPHVYDIYDERITILVFHNDDSIYIPPNPTFASKPFITTIVFDCCHTLHPSFQLLILLWAYSIDTE